MGKRYLIVGSGFSGAVLANRLATETNCLVDIWEERAHSGGNCHTQRDASTQIMVHQYGPHIFNTDRKEIWDYVNRFGNFRPYVHRVKAVSKEHIYNLPVNLQTINQFFGLSMNPTEAEAFLALKADKTLVQPTNFEEQALSFIGKELYDAFFYGYTKKQWGCEPKELPASILKRIPVRFNYDDNYHNHHYTGIPEEGYSAIINKMMNHPNIHLTLNKKFIPGETDTGMYDHVFYTGPLDAYFKYKHGRLGYRTVHFEKHEAVGDFQGATQINYCDELVPYTRITEHKHFTPWEQHEKTVYFVEYSKETGVEDEPYYPKRLEKDKSILKQYRADAEKLSHISFLGRLATYRYMDMHHVIGEALQLADICLSCTEDQRFPVFSNTEAF
ncbi:MAG: UDP-galactopyranose mutase [Ferruginibacter sp.]